MRKRTNTKASAMMKMMLNSQQVRIVVNIEMTIRSVAFLFQIDGERFQ